MNKPTAAKRKRPGEYIGFRAPPKLKRALEASAKENGRSLSTEVQFRLEISLLPWRP
jgi:hypothetical protein